MLRTAPPPGQLGSSLSGISPGTAGGPVHRRRSETPAFSPFPITDRERQVLSLTAEGYSNRLIAAHLAISERTVKSHLTNIMNKLRVSDRTHAVVTAVRLGWLAI